MFLPRGVARAGIITAFKFAAAGHRHCGNRIRLVGGAAPHWPRRLKCRPSFRQGVRAGAAGWKEPAAPAPPCLNGSKGFAFRSYGCCCGRSRLRWQDSLRKLPEQRYTILFLPVSAPICIPHKIIKYIFCK